ncbi:MAG: EF-hand domain-containing protein [Pseudomonadota bacterium]
MKPSVLFLAAIVAVSAVQASAATVEDVDENGTYSMEEMLVSFPELSEVQFAEIDTDDSGEISEEELASAMEKGVISN